MNRQIKLSGLELPQFKINKPVRLIELFAGIGSQAMALRDLGAGFEYYRTVEFDRFAMASYNAIHGTDFKTKNICDINSANLGITSTDKFCYIMTYSFPCQDLSVAGKQAGMTKGSGTRSGLLWEVERLLNECSELPQVLLMENVNQVHSKKNMPDFQKWIGFLESKGYSNYWQDLNAKDYGVAQNRLRTFMVSILGSYNYKFPGPIPLEKKLKDYLEDEVDEKYYINNEKAQKLIQKLACQCGQREPGIIVAMRGRNPENPSDRTAGSPTEQRLEPNSQGICNTLTSVQKDNLLLEPKYHIRKLTPLECWRLMGFSDEDFHKAEEVNSNSQLYKQAGNSIAKNVLIAIFGQIIKGKEVCYKEREMMPYRRTGK